MEQDFPTSAAEERERIEVIKDIQRIRDVIAYPRVTSANIKPFELRTPKMTIGVRLTKTQLSEVIELKASGKWGTFDYPISIHVCVPVGCSMIPMIGDPLVVQIRLPSDTEAAAAYRNRILSTDTEKPE